MVTNSIVDQLKEQLANLEREFRVEIPERIRLAREMGDLRESGEYETAKDRQGFLQARIGFLRQRIAELSSINLANIPKDRVAFGTTVYLTDVETDEERVYRLVASEEVDTERGHISPASPVGRGLVGKREGDQVVVQTPGGTRRFEVSRIVTLHDEPAQEEPKHE
ncbi:MAG TPA: transcription elongation factor GreA [Candidatus Sulfotelmatobacter sp.]|nr:transcription elongation factor GreA [Candidatus Sulfotelmatobacter sp.]